MRKRILTKICAVVMLLVTLIASFSVPSSAVDYGLIEVSDVVADLEKFGVKIEDYQKDVTAEHCRMLYFLEYGYHYYGDMSDYGLYVYVWNPTGKQIDVQSGKNFIQMQTRSNAGTVENGFRKMKLKLCNYSMIEGYEHVFYKFKVEDSKTFYSQVEKTFRQYDISGVELHFKGDRNATDFKVGGVHTCTGFMPYRGPEQTAESTYSCSGRDRVTVELELHPATWKTETSDKGAGYQYEVFSVYFAVPNDIIRDYGDPKDIRKGLVEVNGCYSEYKINGIVSSYSDAYNAVNAGLNQYASKVNFGFAGGHVSNMGTSTTIADYGFNYPFFNIIDSNRAYKVCTAFNSEYSNYEGFSAEQTAERLYEIMDVFGGLPVLNRVDDGCTRGFQKYTIKGDDIAGKVASYASSHKSGLLAFLRGEYDLYSNSESYGPINSIEVVDKSDFENVSSDKALGDKFFVAESEVNGLKKFVNENTNTIDILGNTTYLMRFAVRDYFAENVYFDPDVNNNPILGKDGYVPSDKIYYFEKTVFLWFDVISLTYENAYGQRTVIPVVSSPIDIFGSITVPERENQVVTLIKDGLGLNKISDFISQFKVWFLVIIGLIILALVAWFIKLIGVPIGKLLGKIGRVIKWPFKKTSGAIKKRRAKKAKKKAEKSQKSDEGQQSQKSDKN